MKKNIFTLLSLLLSITQILEKSPIKMALAQSKLEKIHLKRLVIYFSFGVIFLLLAFITILITLYLAISPAHRIVVFSMTSLLLMMSAVLFLIKAERNYRQSYLLGANRLKYIAQAAKED